MGRPNRFRVMGLALFLFFFFLFGWQFSVAILFCIAVHELGHLVAGKMSGVTVTKYRVGFGVPVFTFRSGDTEYGLAPIPFGGFVQFLGAGYTREENEKADREFIEKNPGFPLDRTGPDNWYASKAPTSRIWMLSAGLIVNALTLVLVLTASTLMFGSRGFTEPLTIDSVPVGSLAEGVGLQEGDGLLAVNGEELFGFMQLDLELRRSNEGEGSTLLVMRDGQEIEIGVHANAVPPRGEGPEYDLDFRGSRALGFEGLSRKIGHQDIALSEVPGEVLSGIFSILRGTVFELPKLVSGDANFSRIAGDLAPSSRLGFRTDLSPGAAVVEDLLLYISLLSVVLIVANILPIPPLDGGRLVFPVLELFGVHAGPKLKTALVVVGGLMLLAHMGYIFILKPLLFVLT